MPTIATPRPRSPKLSPPSEWPGFFHPTPVTIIALIMTFAVVNIFFFIIWQLLRRHLTRHCGFVVAYGKQPDTCDNQKHPPPSPSLGSHNPAIAKQDKHQSSLTSEPEPESRQLALLGERMPLFNAESSRARGSLYDTFQVPPPSTTRLKFSRSMMELNGGKPLEGEEGAQKAKTIHWHGVNRLNTAWGWMS